MSESTIKRNRKEIKRFCVLLLRHMHFLDRLSFLISGNFWKPLRKAYKNEIVKARFEWEQLLFWFDIILIWLLSIYFLAKHFGGIK